MTRLAGLADELVAVESIFVEPTVRILCLKRACAKPVELPRSSIV